MTLAEQVVSENGMRADPLVILGELSQIVKGNGGRRPFLLLEHGVLLEHPEHAMPYNCLIIFHIHLSCNLLLC